MKHETWMDLTAVSMKPRSKELQQVDLALKLYHQNPSGESLKRLKLALHHWKMSKGYNREQGQPGWKVSDRNRRGAVIALDSQLFPLPAQVDTGVLADLAELPFFGMEAWAEDEAKQVLREAREEAVATLFLGCKMQLKKSTLAQIAHSLKSESAKASKNATALTEAAKAQMNITMPWDRFIDQARQIVTELINQLLGEWPEKVAAAVRPLLNAMDFIGDLISSVAAYISIAKSGAKAVLNTYEAIKMQYQWVKVEEHMLSLAKGAPEAAAIALREVLARTRNEAAKRAAIYTADAAVKTAGTVADAVSFGVPTVSMFTTPLSGLATAIANIILRIRVMCREVKEMLAANDRLNSRFKLEPALFNTCPILGCYFIACVDTSTLVNFIVEDMGVPGWKFDIEVLVRNHIRPMVGYARSAISNSPMEVIGLEYSKGAVADVSPGVMNFKNRKQKQILDKLKSKVPFVEVRDYQSVAKAQGFTPVTPDKLKTRITGMGSR